MKPQFKLNKIPDYPKEVRIKEIKYYLDKKDAEILDELAKL